MRGAMVQAFMVDDRLYFATRSGRTQVVAIFGNEPVSPIHSSLCPTRWGRGVGGCGVGGQRTGSWIGLRTG